MADTTFSSGTTITSVWLNDVNDLTYDYVTYLPLTCTGDGATNDATALQAAITAGAGGIIDGLGLTYKCNSVLTGITSGTTLRNMTLDFSSVGSSKTCLNIFGDGPIDSSVLASNTVEGAYTVQVAAGQGSKFSPADYVLLTAEDAYAYSAATVKRGEIKQVQSVSGDVVTFRQAIYEVYTTSNTATLRKLSMLENIKLDNVHLIGTNTEGDLNVGAKFNYVNGLKVHNCSFRDIDLYECALYNTINFDVSHNYFDGVRYTGSGVVFYGVVIFNCSQWGIINANRGQELRHLVTTSSSTTYYGQPYFVTINANVMNNAMAGGDYASWAYECHGFGRWITWSGNIADSCHTGINLERGDQVVTGNIFRNCRFNGIYFDSDSDTLRNILITNNFISGPTTESVSGGFFGISLPTLASQVRENILISDNIIENFSVAGRSDTAIRVYTGSGYATNCVISGNLISNQGAYEASDYGIYMEQGGWCIQNNTIYGYERAIQLVTGANNCSVIGNSMSVASIASSSPAIDVDSNGNIIKGNIVRGMYSLISSIGTGNYILENTQIGCTTSQEITAVTDATHDVNGADSTIVCNRAGTITLTLEAASSTPGRQLQIKTLQAQLVNSAGSDVIPLTSATAGTAILPATDGAWCILKSDGTNWQTIAGSAV